MFKNVAAKFTVFAFDSTTNLPKSGDAANITAYVSKDDGTVTVLADTSATEMDATNAKGYYLFDAAQGETNADKLLVSGKSATSNIVVVGAPAVIYTRPTTGWLAPTTAGRTLTVDASGRALSDVDTIKTNPVVNAGTATFPTNATLASTTNITAGTITTVTTVTNQLTAAAIATGVWQDATAGDFTTASSIGKALYVANVVPGGAGGHFIAGTNAATTITTGLTTHLIGTVDTVTTYTGNTPQTGDSYARLGAPAGASVSADITTVINGNGVIYSAVLAAPAAIWTDTTAADFTVANSIGKSIMNGISLGTGLTIAAVSGAVGSVTAGVTLTSGERNSVADAFLARNIAGGSSSGRIVTDALRFLRNKWSVSGTTLTVTQEDDSTSAWTATISTDAAALPIIGTDPT